MNTALSGSGGNEKFGMVSSDKKSGEVDTEVQEEKVEKSEVGSIDKMSAPNQWTTTRWELWAFYVYYIVRLLLLLRPLHLLLLKIPAGRTLLQMKPDMIVL